MSNTVEFNVLTKEKAEGRIAPVFKGMSDIVKRSIGAFGSPAIISKYPHTCSTKDGFTIMKHTVPANQLDREIFSMAFSVCERLNNTVGDGTSTAIVSTNAIYEAYLELKERLEAMCVSSQEIIEAFDRIKEEIVTMLEKHVVHIDMLPPSEMIKYIEQVVTISSNNDREVIKNITSLYEELGYPAISLSLSSSGKTEAYVVRGFACDVTLNDAIYLNTDDGVAIEKDIDIIIFDHKVTIATYENIIKPLSNECKMRRRKLVVVAPFYDSVAIKQKIAVELNREYNQTKSVNTILTTCSSTSSHDKKSLGDLAMLLNTSIITRDLEDRIIEAGKQYNVAILFNMDGRVLDNDSYVLVMTDVEKGSGNLATYSMVKEIKNAKLFGAGAEDQVILNLGHCKNAELSMKKSTFDGFHYNENSYEASVRDAKTALHEAQNKYQEMGTFNLDITKCQNRLYSLMLKVGKIEVGADTTFKQEFLRDVYDDAVKGAASAYKNGIILGCNLSLIESIITVKSKYKEESLEYLVADMFRIGFSSVYRTVIENMLGDNLKDICINDDRARKYLQNVSADADDNTKLTDYIIEYSIDNNLVYDLRSKTFRSDIINSKDTDVQIMNATVGLLSMLIAGNQFISPSIFQE